MDAFVWGSFDLVIVWPINLFGSPLITSANMTSLRIYSADDGLTKNSSKSTTFGVTPKSTLNKILNDSAVPFAWYNDFDSFIKLLTSKLDTKEESSKPGVKDDLIFL